MRNAVIDMTAVELSVAIRTRKVSCREVMEAYMARIATANPTYNAIVSLKEPNVLLAEADRADELLRQGRALGPLHGFPQAPKDATATKDVATTIGSEILKGYMPDHDSFVVARAREAGAIVIGKTNMPEFGVGSHTYNSLFGTTLNAWNKRLSAGGSSGGAAVAVAQRMLPVADGSDMMGSIRNPVGWNNICGLRPTIGRVPTGPTNDVFYQQLMTEGPMGRTVADVALLLSVQAGWDHRLPLSINEDPAQFAKSLDRDFKGARIGFLGDLDGYLPMEPGVMDACTAALKHFGAFGCSVEMLAPGFDMRRLWDAWVALRAYALGASFGPLAPRVTRPEVLWELETYKKLTVEQLSAAMQTRSAWYESLRKMFERHDFFVLPTAQVFPFEATLHWPKEINGKSMDTYHRWMEVVVPGSMAGVPIAAVPAGFGAGQRPIGLQIIGPAHADLAVLQIAHAYEQASGFTQNKPR